MGAEQLAMSSVAAVGRHPWLSNALFRFTKWGNPFADERFIWPYPMYDRMRADGPVAYGRPYRQWFVFGYDEVQEVLRSPHTATAPVGKLLLSTARYRKLSPSARSNFSRWLLVNDAPNHTRLRSAVSRAFTPRQIDRYGPLVAQVVGELVSTLDTAGEIDIVEALTSKLPIQAIAAVLGLPSDRRPWLLSASREIGGMLEPFTPFDPASMSERFAELDAYFRAVIAERRREPGHDLISALATDDHDDERDEHALDDDEIVAMIAFLLFAGHETVTGMLGNALIALARHPEQRTLIRSAPDLIDNAVEELLRFDPPAQVSGRQATADFTVAGSTIRKGDNIGLMIGAANRDKRRWHDADELRLDRPDPKPISFGFGAHHCLGAALARMELRQAIPVMLDALGDYTVDLERTTWKRSFALRGPTVLPLTPSTARSRTGAATPPA
jgi:cytochrome P450